MTAFTGANAIGTYQIEASFDEGDDTTSATGAGPKSFGRNVTVDTFEGVNNGTQLYEFGHRLNTQVVEQNFEGSWSVSFVLSTFEWLEIFDATATDEGTDGDIDYDFSDPQSFEMVIGRLESSATSDIARVATGCIATSFEIDSQVDGTVSVTLSGIYANEYKRETTDYDATSVKIPDAKDALNFADTTLSYDGGTLQLPRGVTLSVENNMSLLSVLGSRVAGDFTVGSLSATLDITEAVEVNDTTTLEAMYGNATNVGDTVGDDKAITITFDNGLSSSSGQVKGVFTLAGFTESYSESGIDVEEDFVSADVTETLTGLSAEITED